MLDPLLAQERIPKIVGHRSEEHKAVKVLTKVWLKHISHQLKMFCIDNRAIEL